MLAEGAGCDSGAAGFEGSFFHCETCIGAGEQAPSTKVSVKLRTSRVIGRTYSALSPQIGVEVAFPEWTRELVVPHALAQVHETHPCVAQVPHEAWS